MNKVPCFYQADDESFFLPLFKELVIELPPISSTVNGIDALIPNVETHRIDGLEDLVVFASEVFCLVRVSFQVKGNDLLVLDIRSHGFAESVSLADLVFAPIMDFAEIFHPGGMPFPYVSGINGNHHIIHNLRVAQTAYLIIDLCCEVLIIEIAGETVLCFDERNRLLQRADNIGQFDVLRRLYSVDHLSDKSLLRLREILCNDS